VKRYAALIPLSREHNTALVLAFRIERDLRHGDDHIVAVLYETLISFWARGLLPHFRAENECLLARLVGHVPESDELIARTHRDHLGIEVLVADMRDSPDVVSRRKLLLSFSERLRTHIRWEEDVLFQSTQEILTEGEMAALGADLTERLGDGNPPLEG